MPSTPRPCGRLRRCAPRSLDPCSRRGPVAPMRRRKTFVALTRGFLRTLYFLLDGGVQIRLVRLRRITFLLIVLLPFDDYRPSLFRPSPTNLLRPIRRLPAPISTSPNRERDDKKVNDDKPITWRPRTWLKQQQTAPERSRDSAQDEVPSIGARQAPHAQGYSPKEHEQRRDLVNISGHLIGILSQSCVHL